MLSPRGRAGAQAAAKTAARLQPEPEVILGMPNANAYLCMPKLRSASKSQFIVSPAISCTVPDSATRSSYWPFLQLLVVSPLTRALQTAQLAFLPHYQGPILVEPLARERVRGHVGVGVAGGRRRCERQTVFCDHGKCGGLSMRVLLMPGMIVPHCAAKRMCVRRPLGRGRSNHSRLPSCTGVARVGHRQWPRQAAGHLPGGAIRLL